MTNEKLIVPVDFTPVAINAAKYAIQMSNKSSSEIVFLHIIENEDLREAGEEEFKVFFNELGVSANNKISLKIEVGNFKKELAQIAERMGGTLIVLGTHMTNGFQKIFGTNAIKIITDSTLPFVVIKEDTQFIPIHKIGMTIDVKEESIQVMESILNLCSSFGSSVVLFVGEQPDGSIKKEVKANIEKVKSIFNSNGITVELQMFSKEKYEREIFEYAIENDVQLIGSTYYSSGKSIFSSTFIEHLIENPLRVPVLIKGKNPVAKQVELFNDLVCPISIFKVDENAARLVALFNVLILITFFVTKQPLFLALSTFDYLVRAIGWFKYSPARLLSSELLKLFKVKKKPTNLGPKIFASRLGFMCAASALVFSLLDNWIGAIIPAGLLAVLASVDGILNICVGCIIYHYLVFPFFKNR